MGHMGDPERDTYRPAASNGERWQGSDNGLGRGLDRGLDAGLDRGYIGG